MKINEIKKEARLKLAQKYPQTLISCFLFLAVIIGCDIILSAILNFVSFNVVVGILVSIIILAITFPLSYGLVSIFLDYSRNVPVKSTDFINRALLNFSNVCKTTTHLLLKFLKYLIIGIVAGFFICLLVGFIEQNVFNADAEQQQIINAVTVIFLSLAFAFGLVLVYLPYSFSYYVLADHPETAGKQSLIESKKMLSNYIWKYVLLYISFLPYGIILYLIEFLLERYTNIPEIGTIVGLVGSIVLMPYILMSVATFFDDINGTQIEEKPKKRGRPKKNVEEPAE